MKVEPLSVTTSLPTVVTPNNATEYYTEALTTWLQSSPAEWNELLLQNGGLLFRGFQMKDASALEQIVRVLNSQPLSYAGGNSPRTRVNDAVYTSTEYPADQIITLHNELSYMSSWPAKILFWCEIPAGEGGETPIIDSRLALRLLPEALVERFETKGLIYWQTLPDGVGLGRSWQATFETTDRSIAEQLLTANGVDFKWNNGGALKIRYHRKATHIHPITGELLWFNQADQWHPASLSPDVREMLEAMVSSEDFPHNVTFGDGTPIDEADIITVRDTLWNHSIVFPWQQGDLLLLDNMLVAHGRRPYTGARKIYVSMA